MPNYEGNVLNTVPQFAIMLLIQSEIRHQLTISDLVGSAPRKSCQFPRGGRWEVHCICAGAGTFRIIQNVFLPPQSHNRNTRYSLCSSWLAQGQYTSRYVGPLVSEKVWYNAFLRLANNIHPRPQIYCCQVARQRSSWMQYNYLVVRHWSRSTRRMARKLGSLSHVLGTTKIDCSWLNLEIRTAYEIV